MGFVHLHVHSEYSLLSSVARIEDLVIAAKEDGQTALALCDKQVMYGVIPFYKACLKHGIKPIIGVEYRITYDEFNREAGKLLLLAKNERGYQHLLSLTTIVQSQENREKSVHINVLKEHCDGLIAIISYDGGEVATLVAKEDDEKALQTVRRYEHIFGSENVFVELQLHDHKDVKLVAQMSEWAARHSLETVASNHVHYISQNDKRAYEVVNALREGMTLQERPSLASTSEFYFKSKRQMQERFSAYPKAIANTLAIAERCQLAIQLGERRLPKYKGGEEAESFQLLKTLAFQGLSEKLAHLSKRYVQRLNEELQVIETMGFSDYFLIVWDFMNYAHQEGIKTGPGRGSAAGSLVAYALNITKVDPVRHGLLFERFLNRERVSLPDIDIDFADDRRDEVIRYVSKKYGTDYVAQIITFGTMAARAAIRDVGRVLNVDSRLVDRIAKAIPSSPGMTLDKAVAGNEQLKILIEETEEAQELFALAKKIEGLPRHTSTHAAGVVISDDPLTTLVPLQSGQDEVMLTQYPMEALEDIGLLKMDFLGLKNLSLIQNILLLIEKNERAHIDLAHISLEDEKVYSLLAKGETTGIFQLESDGMRRVLKELQPTEFEDIVAVNALYRPGPMEQIPLYIRRKHKKEVVTYIHRDLEEILQPTYGVIIYQEQIMKIAAKMANFTLAEADLLRRAVSKKERHILEAERKHFITGAMKKGYNEETANEVYNLIVRFANYGFNRSHAVAYSLIAYELAYLKSRYPEAFYTALCSSVTFHDEKLKQCVNEAKMFGLNIYLPDINKSDYEFTLQERAIRFGFQAIKHVGERAAKAIVTERRHRPYESLFDFCYRLDEKAVSERTIQALIMAGCFDSLEKNRAALLASLDDTLRIAKEKRLAVTEKGVLFSMETKEITKPSVPPYSAKELLKLEKETFGFYVSNHPISLYKEQLAPYERMLTSEAKMTRNSKVRVAGMIEALRFIQTKRGKRMAFAKLSDEIGELDLVIFPNIYSLYEHVLKEGELFFLEGKIEQRKTNVSFVVEKLIAVNELNRSKKERVYLRIESSNRQEAFEQLKEVLIRYPGQVEVIVHDSKTKKTLKLSEDYSLEVSDESLFELKNLLGNKNVVVRQVDDEC